MNGIKLLIMMLTINKHVIHSNELTSVLKNYILI